MTSNITDMLIQLLYVFGAACTALVCYVFIRAQKSSDNKFAKNEDAHKVLHGEISEIKTENAVQAVKLDTLKGMGAHIIKYHDNMPPYTGDDE